MCQQRAVGVLCVLVLTWLGHVDQTEGQLASVSVGPSGVWGILPGHVVVYLNGTRGDPNENCRDWVFVNGPLAQVDVGNNVVWGVDSHDNIYYREGISAESPTGSNWEMADGSLKHVTVSPRGSVWGVANDDKIYYRLAASVQNPRGDSWVEVGGYLTQISAGEAGVWGVAPDNYVYYRQGTYGDTEGEGSSWTQVGDKKMTYVSSGKYQVMFVDMTGRIGYRTGMTLFNPTGTGWGYFEGEGRTVIDSYSTALWSVDNHTIAHHATLTLCIRAHAIAGAPEYSLVTGRC